MRLSVLVFVVFGLTTVFVFPFGRVLSRSIKNAGSDLDDIAALIPIGEIQNIFERYLEDEQVRALFKYFISENPQSEIIADATNSKYVNFINYLHKTDLELHTKLEAVYIYLVLEEFGSASSSSSYESDLSTNKGISGFFNEIKTCLRINELLHLYETKLKTSEDFGYLVGDVDNGNFDFFVAALKNNEL